MPTVVQPAIPVANAQNLVTVVNALRQALIAMTAQNAGRSDLTGTPHTAASPVPSQFKVVSEVWVAVTYTTSDGKTVTIPTLRQLNLTNPVTGETWAWTPAGKSTTGGTVGAAL